MLNVFLTVDVEIWCDGWVDIDAKFPDAFRRYVYGPAPGGEFGLRYQAQVLSDHGLTGVFFVEPLFSGRFGLAPLTEVVGLLQQRRQEVQLHLHTEWLDEWPQPLFADGRGKRQFLYQFPRSEQRMLVAEGLRRLSLAGETAVNCFRAGSFGFNADTLDALADCGVPFDSSYNATSHGPSSGVAPGRLLTDAHRERDITEHPMTIYRTGFGRLRHAQLGACSWGELEQLLWHALESRQHSFVLLSHNFELLNTSKTRADSIVVSRFRKLCAFLDRHRDCFHTRGFHGLGPDARTLQPPPLRASPMRSAWRVGEQLARRAYA